MKYILAAVLVFVVLLISAWNIFITSDRITDLADRALEGGPVKVEISGFRKGLFYNFTIERLTFLKNDEALLGIENISGRLGLLGLFRLKLPLSVTADIAGGVMTSEYDLIGRDHEMVMRISGADTRRIAVFGLYGISGGGTLSGEMHIKNYAGDVRLDINDAGFVSIKTGGISVPLEMFKSAKGALSIKGRTVKVKSFSMEGRDVYARIKGDIRDGRPDLTLEIMPEKSLSELNPMFMLLERYRTSPGYYVVPLTNQPGF